MILTYFSWHVTIISGLFASSLASATVSDSTSSFVFAPISVTNGKAVSHQVWQFDAIGISVSALWNHGFRTEVIVLDGQAELGQLFPTPVALSSSMLVHRDRLLPAKWIDQKDSRDSPNSSVVGTSQFSRNDRDDAGLGGNSGFSTNSRVD